MKGREPQDCEQIDIREGRAEYEKKYSARGKKTISRKEERESEKVYCKEKRKFFKEASTGGREASARA